MASATPMGESALAIVRLSGSLCLQLCSECFNAPSPTPRRVTTGSYTDLSGVVLDQCVFVYYPHGASYTGEQLLEINTHGNPLIVQRVIEDLIARGCRSAEPGEFTRRAFLNGKMDLTQAEAVLDVIHARSERALVAAQRQLSGTLGKAVESLMNQLLQVTAGLEAYIDFPEEDLPEADEEGPRKALNTMVLAAQQLVATSRFKTILHEGARAVIAGLPNAGKSSLLNALLGEERAIVSPEPGTTRDYIEDRITVGSYLLRIVDTAGLREPGSMIEGLGIEKTISQVEKADIVLLVVDSSQPPPTLPNSVLQKLRDGRIIVVENKADLGRNPSLADFLPDAPHCRISALNGDGLQELRNMVSTELEKGMLLPGPDEILVSARHAQALERMITELGNASSKLENDEPTELAAADLRAAAAALEQIVGKIDNERMLDQLFATFCIGK